MNLEIAQMKTIEKLLATKHIPIRYEEPFDGFEAGEEIKIKKQGVCVKCGEELLGNQNSLCQNCI